MRRGIQWSTGLALAATAAGCFALSDASEYEVDPNAAPGGGLVNGVAALNFTMRDMFPHRGELVNVELVRGENNQLRARAKVVMPQGEVLDYPAETILMPGVVRGDDFRLMFFADVNGNNLFDPMPPTDGDHSWIEPVPANGVVDFAHSFDFVNVVPATPLGADLTVRLDLPAGAGATVDQILGEAIDDVLEMRVILTADGSMVGLIRVHRGGVTPNELKLEGIVDSGNVYRIEIEIDGMPRYQEDHPAPQSGAPFTVNIPVQDLFPNFGMGRPAASGG